MRCKHLLIEIVELGTAYTSHVRARSHEWSHDSSFSDYGQGTIEVTCYDCGYHRRFGKRRPRWVKDAFYEAVLNKPAPPPGRLPA